MKSNTFTQYPFYVRKGSRSVVSNSLQPHGLQPTRLLRPWNFPGKNTGVGCHFLLHGIFPTWGLNPHLLHCRQILFPLNYWEVLHAQICHSSTCIATDIYILKYFFLVFICVYFVYNQLHTTFKIIYSAFCLT